MYLSLLELPHIETGSHHARLSLSTAGSWRSKPLLPVEEKGLQPAGKTPISSLEAGQVSGRSIKGIRSDRGKEYTSNEFAKFCENVDVERLVTFQQENVVFERRCSHCGQSS